MKKMKEYKWECRKGMIKNRKKKEKIMNNRMKDKEEFKKMNDAEERVVAE